MSMPIMTPRERLVHVALSNPTQDDFEVALGEYRTLLMAGIIADIRATALDMQRYEDDVRKFVASVWTDIADTLADVWSVATPTPDVLSTTTSSSELEPISLGEEYVYGEPTCCGGRCTTAAKTERAAWTRDIATMLRAQTAVAPELRPGYLAAAEWLDPESDIITEKDLELE
jgi:hypothetical protein